MAQQQQTTAVLPRVWYGYGPNLGRVNIGGRIVGGPRAVLLREFEVSLEPWQARELAIRLLNAAGEAELHIRQYSRVPRRGEFDRIAMGM